jgi:acetyl-CoA synthetase
VFNQFYKATGLKLMEAFGQTETTAVLINMIGTEPKVGSTGKPSPAYDVDLVDNDGNTVPAGTVGEIVLRTPNGKKPVGMFSNYYKNPERTKSVWYNDIYHTGDTAWVDEDGYYWYVGRNDDIIKSSGYRIGPFEIESVLMEHPSVLECAITGVPDPVRGQVIKATIVLARGYTASEELKKELQDYVKNQTAPYKYPRVVEFVAELPKTISGKVRRVQIRGDEAKE